MPPLFYTRDRTTGKVSCKVTGIIVYHDTYAFEGFIFENYSSRPFRINKNGKRCIRVGLKFWDAFARWKKLTPDEKEATRC